MPGVYYPQCVAFFKVLFDGFGETEPTVPPRKIPDLATPNFVNFGGTGAQKATVIELRPKSAQVNYNGYKDADTFELEFDAKLFPFSPELIRNAEVQIHMYHQSHGYTKEFPPRTEKNLMIAGLIDEAHLRLSADGRSFRVSGRDFTSIMLDKTWDPKKRVPHGKDIEQCIQDLVDEAFHQVDGSRLVDVVFEGSTDVPDLGSISELTTLGKVKPQSGATKTADGKVLRKAKPKKAKKVKQVGFGNTRSTKKGKAVHAGRNYWDVIYATCISYGFIVYVRGYTVVIADPKTLLDTNKDKAKQFAYGHNLENLEVERKFSKQAVPQIIVKSYDSINRRVTQGSYPKSVKEKTTAIGTKRDETRVVVVHGITDTDRLDEIAKSYYDNLARSEAKIRFATMDLRDLRGLDLLTVRHGDAVYVGFDAFNDQLLQQVKGIGQRAEILRKLGYSNQMAQLIAEEYERINQFRRPFYVRSFTVHWDNDKGLKVDGEGINFVSEKRDQ